MEDKDEEWVMVKPILDKDIWTSSSSSSSSLLLLKSLNETEKKELKVKFNDAAKHWTDALPIGNGRLGAMVWGGVTSETINLNEDTLWTGVPGNYTNPDAPIALSEVRKLVDDGKYAEATKAAVKLSGDPSDVYQLLGDINLEFEDHDTYDDKTYQRELDLDTATIGIKYSIGDIEFTRQHFASYPDQVLVTKISANKSRSLSFTASLDSKLHHHSYINNQNQIIMEGSCPGRRKQPTLFAENDDNPEGIKFSTVLDLQISNETGLITVLDEKKLRVEGCDWAVLLLMGSSSFDGPFINPSDSKREPTSECLNTLKLLSKFSYSELYNRHVDDYQKLFNRVSLELSKSSDGSSLDVTTAERIKSFKADEDPSLIELLFQYGRYLLISCSRPETQPANLQGIWNDKVEPPWDGAPHLNINLQMNYWPSLSCNLHECQEPLFDYISSLSANGTKTAKVNYEASGWVAHQVSDIWAKTSPDRGEAVWALWPMGGAWLCTHLWEHYTYTMNKDFLSKKAYPLLEGCVSFLLDWLIEGQDGYLETNPSTSPEHMFIAPDGKPASVSYSTTMDMSIIKEVFIAIVSAAEVLGKSKTDLIQRVVKAQPRLYPTKIARDGSILEWAQDFEDPEVHHRHVSHLFGLFPGHTITVERTPDLCKAADFTLIKRGEEGPGWSTTWKAALWARLHNSEHAYRMVKHLFDLVDPDHESDYEGGLYSNMFTAHPPFQIDANFGFCAAIAEMLVQSTIKDLYLLPALPRDKWSNGSVKGLKARGNVTVSISWNEGNLHEFGLWLSNNTNLENSKNQNSTKRLHYKGTTVTAKISSGKVYTFDRKLRCIKKISLFDSSHF
ncbi:alpha-L-fucosidase 2-like [Rutidosis leptorrhynchoides]|uniref:alpha-L-fucosidase 2-like n=1 Tax=Rutidosis leptorrhynchoides TaxID=125765 RepID=UPI003A9A57FD